MGVEFYDQQTELCNGHTDRFYIKFLVYAILTQYIIIIIIIIIIVLATILSGCVEREMSLL
jgi:hypothetical protein